MEMNFLKMTARLFFFYLSYLSSIHVEANCIAIFWAGLRHSFKSCYFRVVWDTCLPHKGGGVSLSVLPKDTTRELAGLFSTTFPKCRAGKLWIPFFKVVWYDSTRGLNPRSTDCEADALITKKIMLAKKIG